MIGYFDTSALVPLLIAEPTSASCRRLWDDADAVVITRLSYAEAAAALTQALRLARLTEQSYQAAMRLLDRLWDEFGMVDVNDRIVRRAAQLSYTCALRGYDAVHCSSAEQLKGSDLVVAAGDRKLLKACLSLGMAAPMSLANNQRGVAPCRPGVVPGWLVRGTVRELDVADVPSPANVGGVEFTGSGIDTHPTIALESAQAATVDSIMTAVPASTAAANQYVISIGGRQGMITFCVRGTTNLVVPRTQTVIIVSEVRCTGLLAMSPNSQSIMI